MSSTKGMALIFVCVLSELLVPAMAQIVALCPPGEGPCIWGIMLFILFVLVLLAFCIRPCIGNGCLKCCRDNDRDAPTLNEVVVCPNSTQNNEQSPGIEMRDLQRIPFDGVRDFRYDAKSGAYVDVNYESYLRRTASDATTASLRSDSTEINNGFRDPGQHIQWDESSFDTVSELNLSWEKYVITSLEGEDELDAALVRQSLFGKTRSRPKSFTPTLLSIGEELEETSSDDEMSPQPSRPLSLVVASNEVFGPVTDLSVTA